MREVSILTYRMIKLYLKNPLALLFSFVYMILIISLFSLFLGEYMAKGMIEAYAEVQGVDFTRMRWLVDAAAMAGVLMINCILVPLNVLTVMVQDKENNKLDSFLVTAVSRDKLMLGYWTAPFLVGVVMNLICLWLVQAVMVMSGGEWLTLQQTLVMTGLIVINTFSSTSIIFVVALLMKNAGIYNTVTGIVSALVGFVTGVFLPIGVYPASIQRLFALLPAHYGATVMRQVMTEKPLVAVFGGVPDQKVKGAFMTAQEIVDIYSAENGIVYLFGGIAMPFTTMLVIIIGAGIVFMMLSVLWLKRHRKK